MLVKYHSACYINNICNVFGYEKNKNNYLYRHHKIRMRGLNIKIDKNVFH